MFTLYKAIDMNAFKVIAMPSDSLIHLDALNTFIAKKPSKDNIKLNAL